MIAGDPHLRNFSYPYVEKSHWQDSDRTEAALRQKAVGFNCLNYAEPANAALGLRNITVIPDMANTCADGLRAEVFFPSCWNGEDDPTNFRDHMRYPSLMDDGTCPEGFETRLVSLFFETIWDVAAFKGQQGQFVFSTGDPTGNGYHGDFINAWDRNVLQSAIDSCTSLSGLIQECDHIFDLQTSYEMRTCTIEPTIDEDVVGPLKEIPGCNVIQPGPAYATDGGCANDPTSPPPIILSSSSSEVSTATATESSAGSSTTPDVYEENYSSGDFGYPVGYANVAIQDVDDEPSAAVVDPDVITITITTYTTVAETTVTVTAEPEPTPLVKRHAHHHHRRAGHPSF